jgi:hypothetical protein
MEWAIYAKETYENKVEIVIDHEILVRKINVKNQ